MNSVGSEWGADSTVTQACWLLVHAAMHALRLAPAWCGMVLLLVPCGVS